MDPNIIVMITLLALPNGDNGVHVKPFESVAACTEAAEIEATDPFVAHVECSELTDGNITLNFKRSNEQPVIGLSGKAAS
ncbi:MAG: hypothetical protein IT537_27180 [Hyphomicrobiales bacterium]|nr:hypothetical protein [Hyphomicrobiales bacterium]